MMAIYKKLGLTKNEFEEKILNMYFNEQLSQQIIANRFNCNVTCIEGYCKRLGLVGRTRTEQAKILMPKNTPTQIELDIISGWLLSDGHMEKQPTSSRLSIGLKYIEPLENLIKRLPSFVFSPIWQSKLTNCYHIKSHSYSNLSMIRDAWYPNNIKIVPELLKINPTIAYYWYIGDGHLKYSGIQLSTDSFDLASTNSLKDQLVDLGIRAKINIENRIILSAYSVDDFLSYIGPCQDSGFLYKWDVVGRKNKLREINNKKKLDGVSI